MENAPSATPATASNNTGNGVQKGGLAQLVERLLCKQNVNGSNPLTSTTTRKSGKRKAESGNEEFQLSAFRFQLFQHRACSSVG
jgi:hypothetical protein